MKRVALAALLVLGLAGCAIPGQELDPGTAMIVEGREVTFDQIDATYDSWLQSTQGKVKVTRRQVATIEAIREPVLAAAQPTLDQLNFELTDSFVRDRAREWYSLQGIPNAEISDHVLEAVRVVLALNIVVQNDPDGMTTVGVIQQVESSIVASPRLGEFDLQRFFDSLIQALQKADRDQLGQFSYTTLVSVDGFVDTPSDVRKPPGVPAQTAIPVS